MKSSGYFLEDRAVIAVSGADRISLLQGLVSNDVRVASPERCIWTAMLTPQGRYLCDFFIFATSERLWLDVAASDAERLIHAFMRYRLRAKVVFDQTPLGVYAGWDGTVKPEAACNDPRCPDIGWRAIGVAPTAQPEPGASVYDQRRLAFALTSAADCIVEKTLLLEANFDQLNGISWEKGCYLGQEVTARTRYRGLIKRRLMPISGSSPLPPKSAALTDENGQLCAEMRSSNGTLGLAMVQRSFWQRPTLWYQEQALRLEVPTWFERSDSDV